MIRTFTFVLACCALCAVKVQADISTDIRTVMVRNNEIYIESGSSPAKRITNDGLRKSLPVWSKDGERIAFVEQADQHVALVTLVVVDQLGHVLSELPVKPTSPGEVASGMRYVEALEWLSESRIAVSGSVNPSTTEYNIFDVVSRKSVKEFFDDGHGAAFSPDGRNYVYVSGSPHFTPANDRAATLFLDDKPMFGGSSTQVDFVARPRWSHDGKSFAVLTSDQSGKYSIISATTQSTAASITSLPFTGENPDPYFWSNEDLYLTRKVIDEHPAKPMLGLRQNRPETWRLLNGTGSWEQIDAAQAPEDLDAKARNVKSQLNKMHLVADGKNYDYWCDKCVLTELPRRSSTSE